MTDRFDFGEGIVWQPDQKTIEQARVTEFMRLHGISDYQELLDRSTADVAWFTDAILKYLDIRFYQPYHQVLDLTDGIAWPRWCLGGKLNIVHNCLDKYIGTPKENQTAFIYESEAGQVRTYTYLQLFHDVNQAANLLRSLGLGRGDGIGVFMPMAPEVVVAVLAIAKIGGIILPLFSGYGTSALITRLNDGEAKAIFVADGFHRRGKPIAMKPTADQAAEQVPSLRHMIVLNHSSQDTPMSTGRDLWWHEHIPTQPIEADTEQTEAEDILMIIYTSGTTGRPKGAVHTHCGAPVKYAQDMAFGTDIHPGELIYWMTDMGWMMGPWLVFGTLLNGASFFIYDGAPDYPTTGRLWQMIERHRINILGLSPTLVRSLLQYGQEPFKDLDLSSLKLFASTGEPWNPGPWKWLFDVVGNKNRPIINYSGGTEIGGGIVMGNPTLPIKVTAISCACPGIDADIFNQAGESIRNEVGELVVKAPWIGMTRGFWKDPGRYEETYWSRYPDTWLHGDWAVQDEDGMWYVLGRSDDAIKVAGKQLAPAEVESILVGHPDVLEAGAIGVPHKIKGNELVVFCTLTGNAAPGDVLESELIAMIADKMGKPLAPRQVLFVSDLPKTRNAKVMRRMIRSAYLGLDPGDISSLVNPETIEEIRSLR